MSTLKRKKEPKGMEKIVGYLVHLYKITIKHFWLTNVFPSVEVPRLPKIFVDLRVVSHFAINTFTFT